MRVSGMCSITCVLFLLYSISEVLLLCYAVELRSCLFGFRSLMSNFMDSALHSHFSHEEKLLNREVLIDKLKKRACKMLVSTYLRSY